MDVTEPCPMCGATLHDNAKRCHSCGESFQLQAKRVVLRAPVTKAGIVPGAIVGVSIRILSIAAACANSSEFRESLDLIVMTVYPALSLFFGAAGGMATAAVVRAVRNKPIDPRTL